MPKAKFLYHSASSGTETTASSSSSNDGDEVGADIEDELLLRESSPQNIGKVSLKTQITVRDWWSKLKQWYERTMRLIESESAAFQAALTERDLRDLKLARLIFHSCSVIPPMIYYSGAVEHPTKFPATISFTIRKGLSKKAHILLWTTGWVIMGKLMRRAGSKRVSQFCTQMYLTGVWTTIIFSLGKGQLSDVAHFLGAGAYMIDHVMLFKLLNTKPIYRKVFCASFLTLCGSLAGLRGVEERAGLPHEEDHGMTTADRARKVRRLSPQMRRNLFIWELLVMLSENLLFTSFVQGMPTGIEDNFPASEDLKQNSQKKNKNNKMHKERWKKERWK